MSYQKCPICNGTGISPHGLSIMISCLTCKGHGIINEMTGYPPGGVKGPTKDISVKEEFDLNKIKDEH